MGDLLHILISLDVFLNQNIAYSKLFNSVRVFKRKK